MILPPLIVRKVFFSLLGKFGGKAIGGLLLRYKPAVIGIVGLALVAGGAYLVNKLRTLDDYKASVATLTQALETERANVQTLEAEYRKSLDLINQRNTRITQLDTHARELVARLREIPANEPCLDTAAPGAVLDLLRQ